MNVVVIGLSHRSAPVELRERFAFAGAEIPGALRALRASGVAAEAVILSTCNRVEIYAATALAPAKAFAGLKEFLVRWDGIGDEPLTSSPSPQRGEGVNQFAGDKLYTFAEPESLRHLFRVACGLDSMVLGETEILGQVKAAYDLALRRGHTGARLNKIFQRAFHAAKHIRAETNIQRGSVSVASVAVGLAEKIFNSLADRAVLVIGAGDTSGKVARAFASRGARNIVVASRTFESARALANELGGRAIRFDDWAGEIEKTDIAVSSTSAPRQLLDRAGLEPLMKRRRNRPLLLMDLAVPRDIDPEVNFLENVYLYNVDDLQGVADDCLELRRAEIARCEEIILEKVAILAGGGGC